jgi:hypothetical protein
LPFSNVFFLLYFILFSSFSSLHFRNVWLLKGQSAIALK